METERHTDTEGKQILKYTYRQVVVIETHLHHVTDRLALSENL